MKRKVHISTIIYAILVPVLFGLILRLVFGLEAFADFLAVMSVTFLFFLPFGIGVLTILISHIENVRSKSYQALMPWLPILILFILTIILDIEGWGCWIMLLPLCLFLSSLGGLTAGYFRLKRHDRKNRLQICLVFILPFLMSPLEQMIKVLPTAYTAYTEIDINAPAGRIWENVVRVKEIPEKEDKGYLTSFLSFPRPIKAELNYAGVGGSRQAIFSKGLVFHEAVLEYANEKHMHFTIKAYPYEIPSTTMDKHIVIGGDYFDVLDGTYDLERLNDSTCRLHLYSHFQLKTHFNFYASWWARWIMKDIQNNILQVIKKRSES